MFEFTHSLVPVRRCGGFLLALLVGWIGTGAGVVQATGTPPSESTMSTLTTTKIRLKTAQGDFEAVLHDSASARDFASLLPLNLQLRDYARTEFIADLPRDLSRTGAPRGHAPKAGDLTVYAPWGNLALFYREAAYADGLIPLGRFAVPAELRQIQVPQDVVLELVETP